MKEFRSICCHRNQLVKVVVAGYCLVSLSYFAMTYSSSAPLDNVRKADCECSRHVDTAREQFDHRTSSFTIKTTTRKPQSHVECDGCVVYDLSEPFKSKVNFECLITSTKPPVPMCLYSNADDIWVSRTIRDYGHWEGNLVEKVIKWLHRDPDMGFIDIGANIGMYSLVVAKTGHKVVAVEPNIKSVVRIHQSALLGGTHDVITLLQNGVSDKKGVGDLIFSNDNQGHTMLKASNSSKMGDTLTSTKLIYLDDVAKFCKFKKAVMKIDIEDHEHKAFVMAGALFDAIDIKVVMMEWDALKNHFSQDGSEDKMLVEKMMEFLLERKFHPYPWRPRAEPLDVRKWGEWPFDIVWMKETSPEFIYDVDLIPHPFPTAQDKLIAKEN